MGLSVALCWSWNTLYWQIIIVLNFVDFRKKNRRPTGERSVRTVNARRMTLENWTSTLTLTWLPSWDSQGSAQPRNKAAGQLGYRGFICLIYDIIGKTALTYWGLNKMAPILKKTFSTVFPLKKIVIFWFKAGVTRPQCVNSLRPSDAYMHQ